jgi:hypothetical protein
LNRGRLPLISGEGAVKIVISPSFSSLRNDHRQHHLELHIEFFELLRFEQAEVPFPQHHDVEQGV